MGHETYKNMREDVYMAIKDGWQMAAILKEGATFGDAMQLATAKVMAVVHPDGEAEENNTIIKICESEANHETK